MSAQRTQESAPPGTPAMKTASNSTLVSANVFECYIMPKRHSISNTLVPRMLHKTSARRRRIVSVEVHRIGKGKTDDDTYEECIVRVLLPISVAERREANKRAREHRRRSRSSAGTGGGGAGTSSVASSSRIVEQQDDDEESSVASDASTIISPEYMDAGDEFTLPDHVNKTWKAKFRFPIKLIEVKGTRRNSVHIEIDLGKKHRQPRELIFDSTADAERFQAVMRQETERDKERSKAKMKVAMGGRTIRLDESITFLVEIVSGWELPAGDYSSSDPFVSCIMDGQELHRTDYISKTLDPIWTVATGSLFLLTVDVKQLFRGEGLLCVVLDYDKVGGNERLGAITIPPKTLYDAKGERMVFKLGPPPGKTEDVPGYLAVRCRRASQEDIDFMKKLADSKKKFSTVKDPLVVETASKGGASNLKSIVSRRSRVVKFGPNAGTKEYKIRPGPDPERPDETTWMTKEQLQAECEKDSKYWIDAGTGQFGRLFVEILGCDELPNLDTGGFAGNKTDAFVSLVFEDAVVQTDIIDDTLAPRWLPWMKRAFIFHIMHSSSQLFLGVFDYDNTMNPTDDHDLVGRISVDISNLRKNTMYTLKYNIYTTARMSQRKKKGTITLRLRLEIENDRQLLLSTLDPPPQMYVNVKTRKEFRVVRYTCTGKYNMEKYSMKVINSYIEELLALQHVLFYLQDGATTLLLWRGTCPIRVAGKTYVLPIHSLSAFLIMTFLVEHPRLIPSFFFGGIAWLLLAAQSYRRSLPDVWSRCKSYQEFVQVLIYGESPVPPESIKPMENYEAAQDYLENWEKRITSAEEAAAKSYEEQLRTREEYEKEMEELGDTADTDIATKNEGGVSIDPFKAILFPVQQNLAMICRYARHVKHVISWQECYIAFWVTSGCLLLSVICFFVPWFFLIKWSARLTIWALYGPQNKLVDVFYVSKIKPLTEEEKEEKNRREREERRLQTMSAVAKARVKREDAAKLKAMKKLMFGKFITRVPILKEDRYRDLPMPESKACPYKPDQLSVSELAMADAGYHKVRQSGQHLVGDMIPKVQTIGFTEAPIGQPTAHPALVDKSRPGGSLVAGADSTAAAYIKLGSLVVVSAAVTWFGVPLLSSITERALEHV